LKQQWSQPDAVAGGGAAASMLLLLDWTLIHYDVHLDLACPMHIPVLMCFCPQPLTDKEDNKEEEEEEEDELQDNGKQLQQTVQYTVKVTKAQTIIINVVIVNSNNSNYLEYSLD